jgi:hypothetical protein
MSNTDANVSFGKPKATGAVYIAPVGTALPTSASATLDPAFVGMGYIDDNGLVNSIKTDTKEVHAWGGDLVLNGQTTFAETFMVNLLETSAAALGLYYGAGNVSVSGSSITVTQNSAILPTISVVFELVMTGGRIKRIVIPTAQIVDRSGDITYTDGDAITYPALFTAFPDANGNYHTEYIAKLGS